MLRSKSRLRRVSSCFASSDHRHANMKELRSQHLGRPLRTLFAFDQRRCAILLICGDKTGDDRFYDRMIPVADLLYDEHLEQLRKEGLIQWRGNSAS